MAQNCLPTDDNLQKRSIQTRYDCLVCNRFETVDHCFFHCHYTKETWTELKKYHHISLKLKNFLHIRQWLLEWINEAPDFQFMVFTIAVWYIWGNKNNIRNGESFIHPQRVVGKINAYIDFVILNNFRSTHLTR